jgi:hypothetical protein
LIAKASPAPRQPVGSELSGKILKRRGACHAAQSTRHGLLDRADMLTPPCLDCIRPHSFRDSALKWATAKHLIATAEGRRAPDGRHAAPNSSRQAAQPIGRTSTNRTNRWSQFAHMAYASAILCTTEPRVTIQLGATVLQGRQAFGRQVRVG